MTRMILIFILLVYNLFGASQIKIICDRNNAKIYIDKQYSKTCSKNIPIKINLPAGKHTVEVKQTRNDGSYYYFKKNIITINGKRTHIATVSDIVYTELYFYKNALHEKSVDAYKKYLKEFPRGKYYKKIQDKLESLVWNKAVKTKDYSIYIKILPHGRHIKDAKKRMNNKYYLECMKKPSGCINYIKKGFSKKRINNFFIEIDRNIYYLDALIGAEDDDGNIIVAYNIKRKRRGDYYTVIKKYDKNFDLLWSKILYNDSYRYGNVNKINTFSDGYLITGNFVTGSSYDSGWAILLDKKGNIKWEKTLNEKYFVWQDSIITNDGFLVAGVYARPFSTEYIPHLRIAKYTLNGDLVWDKKLQGTDYMHHVLSIQKTQDGNIFIAYKENIDTFYDNKGDVSLYKIDMDGNILWHQDNFDSYNDYYPLKCNKFMFASFGDVEIINLNKNNKNDIRKLQILSKSKATYGKIMELTKEKYGYYAILCDDGVCETLIHINNKNEYDFKVQSVWLIKNVSRIDMFSLKSRDLTILFDNTENNSIYMYKYSTGVLKKFQSKEVQKYYKNANNFKEVDECKKINNDSVKKRKKTQASINTKKVYRKKCAYCHDDGVGPKKGDKKEWEKYLLKGIETVYIKGIKGTPEMPPKGGASSLSDKEFKKVVDYMIENN